jgi:hypothetical protein
VLPVVAVSGAAPAGAIVHGEPDLNQHPYVGAMAAYDAAGRYLFRCSGSLVGPELFVTAGHCAFGLSQDRRAARATLFFDHDLTSDPDFPTRGDAMGVPVPHPDYDNANFTAADVGVVVLDAPYHLDEYAQLPPVDHLDTAHPGITDFDTVGYGLQRWSPVDDRIEAYLIRELAHPRMIGRYQYGVIVSTNADTGGACFGDSGGPLLVAGSSTVVGVTGGGRTGACAGQYLAFRVDQSWVIDWLHAMGAP